jgi:hypothetical protein
MAPKSRSFQAIKGLSQVQGLHVNSLAPAIPARSSEPWICVFGIPKAMRCAFFVRVRLFFHFGILGSGGSGVLAFTLLRLLLKELGVVVDSLHLRLYTARMNCGVCEDVD